MPPVFVGIPSTAELIDSLTSYFDGMDSKPSIPEEGTIEEVLTGFSKGIEPIFTKSEKGEDLLVFCGFTANTLHRYTRILF